MKTRVHHLFARPGNVSCAAWVTLALLSTLSFQSSTAHAQGTAFTYQGQLNSGPNPAQGIYDLRFTIYDSATNGSVVAGPLTNSATAVTNGLFTVMLDFGSGVFNGSARWLDIAVRTNGATSFTALTPRQALTATPYAIMAASASNLLGTLPAGQLSGTIPASQLSGAAGAATNFVGALSGDVTGTQSATVVSSVGGQTAANVAAGASAANAATSAATANTLVKRDASGNLTNNSITLNGNLNLPATTASAGIIYSGGSTLVHNYGSYNFFAGGSAGNLTMSGQGNTASGFWALYANTSGSWNTANGAWALWSNTSGYDNTASGNGALNNNTNGNWNTANGYWALYNNTSGSNNIALGCQAGCNLTTGSGNIDIGNPGLVTDANLIRIGSGQTTAFIAGVINGNGGGLTNLNASQLASGTIPLAQLPAAVLTNGEAGNVTLNGSLILPATATAADTIYSGSSTLLLADINNNFFAGIGAGNLTTSGYDNVGVGNMALPNNTSGNYNTANGYEALYHNTSGSGNTANGSCALYNNTNSFNTANGNFALYNNTGGSYNTANGDHALYANTSGSYNTANGAEALRYNTNSFNTANGGYALFYNTSGSYNTANGYAALTYNTNGSDNIANGAWALYNNTSGSNNIALGYQAGYNLTTGSSNIDIGNPGLAADTNIIRIGSGQAQTFIAGNLNANGAGLTNLNINMANFGGLLPKSRIDDGGDAAYEQFLGPAKSLSSADPLPFSDLSLVSSNSGAAPSFTFLLNGAAFGTVAGFVGHEAISEPYEYVVEVIAPSSALDPDAQLGLQCGLTFARNSRSTTFAGIVTGCSMSSYDGTSVLYTFRLESQLAYLALWTDYRIYQNTKVPDLVSTLFQNHGYTIPSQSLTGSYSPRESAIQFGETGLNFFSRLLEDEGIFYFFDPSGSPPTLILGNNAGAYLSAPNSPFSYYGDTATYVPPATEFVQTFQKANRESVKTSTISAYNFKTPALNLQGISSADEGQGELYQFGSSGNTVSALNAQARLRVERQTVERNTIFGTGNAPDLRPGCTFMLTDQTGAGLDGSYLVTAVRHGAFRRLTNGVARLYYGNEFEVIPATVPYRPALKTPKPLAQPCTAIVTGPAGEEIYPDEYGRVKVQFYWDRLGQNNEQSSAWIRVASQWAGQQWGMIFLPRIGQEVMVDFLQGDPDQPVITGSFYNANNMPPYPLPADKTVSGIKTHSSIGGSSANYNEIRFEDKKGLEALGITAEKDMTISVGNNLATSVGHNLGISVIYDLTNSAGHNLTTSASHNLTTSASHDLTTSAVNDLGISAGHDLGISAGNNFTLSSVQGIGVNTANDPAYALNVGGAVKAASFTGSGAGITGLTPVSLPSDVAYLDSNQIFSAQTIFTGQVAMFNLQIYSYLGMNDKDLYLRSTSDHGLGWYGGTKLFAGNSLDGPVLYGYAGGGLGTVQSGTSTNLVLTWNSSGKVGIGTNVPTATLDVVGDGRVRGLFRSGSESGTSEAPSPAGLVVRRVNSISIVSNTVVAVARTYNNTTNITLVRDGTAAGFQIQYPALPGNITIACMGIDNTGTARNYYTNLASSANAGTVQIYSNSVGVVHFECTFGITYNAGQHLTQVTLSRYGTDTFWSGTLMSTYNQ